MMRPMCSTAVRIGLLAAALAALTACGGSGGGGGAHGVRHPGGDGDGETAAHADDEEEMIPSEKLDSLHATFERKGRTVSHCLVEAIEAGEVGKSERAVITLTVAISPQGQASNVRVSDQHPDSKAFADCVIGHVEKLEFTTLPRALDYSYTYAFDAL